MGRRTIARVLALVGWYCLMGAVVAVYAYIVVAVMNSLFGPARSLFAALAGAAIT